MSETTRIEAFGHEDFNGGTFKILRCLFLLLTLSASTLHAQLGEVPDWMTDLFQDSKHAALDSLTQGHVYGIIGGNSTPGRMWNGPDYQRPAHEKEPPRFNHRSDRKNRFIGAFRATLRAGRPDQTTSIRFSLWSDSTRGLVTQESDTVKGKYRKLTYLADIAANVAIVALDDKKGRVALIFDLQDLLDRTMTANTDMSGPFHQSYKKVRTAEHLGYPTSEYTSPQDPGYTVALAEVQPAPEGDTWNWVPLAIDPGKPMLGGLSPLPKTIIMRWSMQERGAGMSYTVESFEPRPVPMPTFDLRGYTVHDERGGAPRR